MPREACAGAVVFDSEGRLLLVRRGHAPSIGLWCEPSGRCNPGEDAADAAVRECAEETGLTVRVARRAGATTVDGSNGTTYEITDFVCELVHPTTEVARAGDDAAEVRWVGAAELDRLPLAPGVYEALHAWGCLPRR